MSDADLDDVDRLMFSLLAIGDDHPDEREALDEAATKLLMLRNELRHRREQIRKAREIASRPIHPIDVGLPPRQTIREYFARVRASFL